MPFVFYDLETSGTSPAFDPPLQFAAIMTDDDLNPHRPPVPPALPTFKLMSG